VVWATGYRSDYSWISIPGVTANGHVVHRRGSPTYPDCTSSACPGSTPVGPHCSDTSLTTRPTSRSALPPACKPLDKPRLVLRPSIPASPSPDAPRRRQAQGGRSRPFRVSSLRCGPLCDGRILQRG
jgi:hypothetical protein